MAQDLIRVLDDSSEELTIKVVPTGACLAVYYPLFKQ